MFADIAVDLFPYMNIYKTNDNYDIDPTDSPDEVATPIYEGDVPQSDVAGGEENPYVSDTEESTTESTEADEYSEDEYSEDEYSEDEYSEDEYSEGEYEEEY